MLNKDYIYILIDQSVFLPVKRYVPSSLILLIHKHTSILPCLKFQKMSLILGLFREGYRIYHRKPDVLLFGTDMLISQHSFIEST